MIDLQQVLQALQDGKAIWRTHGQERMLERSIGRRDILQLIERGQIIENYPDTKPFPSSLVHAVLSGRPLHAVIAWDGADSTAYVVTVYEPDLSHFEADFKTRRQKTDV